MKEIEDPSEASVEEDALVSDAPTVKKKLTRAQRAKAAKQKEVIELMCQGKTDTQICAVVESTGSNSSKHKNIDKATISLWRREPEFRAALDAAIQETYLDEDRIKLRVRAIALSKLEAALNSQIVGYKVLQMALDLTKPERKTDAAADIIVQFGPALGKKIASHLDIMKDPTEDEDS